MIVLTVKDRFSSFFFETVAIMSASELPNDWKVTDLMVGISKTTFDFFFPKPQMANLTFFSVSHI